MIKNDYGYLANKRDRVRPIHLDEPKASVWPKVWLALAYLALSAVILWAILGFLS